MYLINSNLTNNILTNDGLNCLLKDIDRKILYLAKDQFLNLIYGFNKVINIDLYEDLCDYKEILLDKLMGCNCLDDEFIIYITGRIQELINK